MTCPSLVVGVVCAGGRYFFQINDYWTQGMVGSEGSGCSNGHVDLWKDTGPATGLNATAYEEVLFEDHMYATFERLCCTVAIYTSIHTGNTAPLFPCHGVALLLQHCNTASTVSMGLCGSTCAFAPLQRDAGVQVMCAHSPPC